MQGLDGKFKARDQGVRTKRTVVQSISILSCLFWQIQLKLIIVDSHSFVKTLGDRFSKQNSLSFCSPSLCTLNPKFRCHAWQANWPHRREGAVRASSEVHGFFRLTRTAWPPYGDFLIIFVITAWVGSSQVVFSTKVGKERYRIPSQVAWLLESWNPFLHVHLYDPGVSTQPWEHSASPLLHSSLSAGRNASKLTFF